MAQPIFQTIEIVEQLIKINGDFSCLIKKKREKKKMKKGQITNMGRNKWFGTFLPLNLGLKLSLMYGVTHDWESHAPFWANQ